MDQIDTNNRDSDYGSVVKKIIKRRECPFCSKYLDRYHKKPILYKTKYWLLTDNMYMYRNARVHLLLIHRKHVESINEVSAEAWSDLRDVIEHANELRKIGGAAFLLRYGNNASTGASVAHLHAHIISGPGVITSKSPPVWARVG